MEKNKWLQLLCVGLLGSFPPNRLNFTYVEHHKQASITHVVSFSWLSLSHMYLLSARTCSLPVIEEGLVQKLQ